MRRTKTKYNDVVDTTRFEGAIDEVRTLGRQLRQVLVTDHNLRPHNAKFGAWLHTARPQGRAFVYPMPYPYPSDLLNATGGSWPADYKALYWIPRNEQPDVRGSNRPL